MPQSFDPSSTDWTEVGDRCFARRYDPYDVTVGVVVGDDGLLVVDTRSGPAEAHALRADLDRRFGRPVRWVVNTHWHFDHCFGNGVFDSAAIYGHESVPATLAARAETVRAELVREHPERSAELDGFPIVPPTELLSSLRLIDVGGRGVELIHPGRGHTDGDLVIRVPDADVVYAGDLVEESGPPAYGDDSFPLSWPDALDVLSGLLTDDTSVVPGHGAVVDREFVRRQRDDLIAVAETIKQLAQSGVPENSALAAGSWPFSAEQLTHAVARGYAELDVETRRKLPLL